MSRLIILGSLCLLSACAKQPQVQSLAEIARDLDFGATPNLPSPGAQAYISAPGSSTDVAIAPLVSDYSFDAGLAASGASLALEMAETDVKLDRWALRQALWDGGFPYPVLEARTWYAPRGAAPPTYLFTWLEQLPKDLPMALVRARGKDRDAWVGLYANPAVDLGVLPRVTSVGTRFEIPQVPGATYTLSDPRGNVYAGNLEQPEQLVLAITGEWLMLITRGDQELARFPMYVGVAPPSEPALSVADEAEISDSASVNAHVRTLLSQIRRDYRLPIWTDDPLLDAAAKAWQDEGQDRAVEILRGVGYSQGQVVLWQCQDTTTENCIDSWIWDPTRRPDLFSKDLQNIGVASQLDTTGLKITLVLQGSE